uniref:efflux RND transporter periplasmic adaptor subunit n=1 Tax=uncultured Caulobacter sp. TaxID=158749 RepID=UPI0025F0023B|nr:HlyD family efflux transporter periplasmic adaptor subunit [uncultured Caulobacter sp.]
MATRNAAGPRTLMLGVAAVALLGAGFGVAKLTTKAPPAAEAPAAAAKAAPSTVKVDQSYLKASNISLQTVTAGDFGGQVQGSGSVVATPGGEAVLTAHAAGAVVRIFKRLGEPVRAGETLALVESRDAALIAGQRGAADARAAAGASRVAADGRSVAVVSPISGKVTAAPATLGAFVQSESELFRVADGRDVQIEVAVSPQDAARILPGASATVRNAAGATITATVRSVTPTLNPQTRSATVVLSVSGGSLVPGEAVQATITARGSGQPGFILPEEAVQSLEGRDVVFVRTATGFAVRPVVVSTRSGGQALIVSGLKAGDSVAARNAFLLKAEIVKGADAE